VQHADGLTAILMAVFGGLILFFLWWARRGHVPYVRPIAGITAMEEAIGRATELGRKILYLPGAGSVDDNQTIASLAVMRHVASLSASYGADLSVLNKDPLTFAAAQETVREAYLQAGRPDLYTPERVTYVTYDQFAFTAAVTGIMVRERPAANFFIGAYQAESLLLAETGQSVGALQIAGTAEVTQLPFFAVVCDYTLMGEELYAASAYLAKEPLLLGTLKAQDLSKMIIVGILILGALVTLALRSGWVINMLNVG